MPRKTAKERQQDKVMGLLTSAAKTLMKPAKKPKKQKRDFIYPTGPGSVDVETSRDREAYMVKSGKAKELQDLIVSWLPEFGEDGAIVHELGEIARERHDPTDHHGKVSSALTNVLAQERVSRLLDRRSGCLIYVAHEHMNGRVNNPYVPKNHDNFEQLTKWRALLNHYSEKYEADVTLSENWDNFWDAVLEFRKPLKDNKKKKGVDADAPV